MRWVALVFFGGALWTGLQGRADLLALYLGGLLGAAVAWLTGVPWRGGFSLARLARAASILARLAVRFVAELAVANVQQLRLVLSRPLRVRPRWVRFTTRLEYPATRVVLGVLISMTPGTVTEDLQADQLYVHVLSGSSGEDVVARIRERFETLLLDLETL